MKVNLFPPLFLALLTTFAAVASAGPDDTVSVTRTEIRQKPVVPLRKQIVDKILVACGVLEPACVYVDPGYLETAGPAPMLIYRQGPPMRPRRVAHLEESVEKPVPAPAASPTPSPAANLPAANAANASTALTAPVPAPASLPTDPEPSLLPETGAGNSAGANRTQEMLSYFQRQPATARPNNAAPVPPGLGNPYDPAGEPSFLQAPQAPEQPVLPPSRATYRVTP